MAEQSKTPKRFLNLFSESMNIFQLLFALIAAILFISSIGILIYQVWGFVTGQGWNWIYLAHLLYYVFGDAPPADQMSTVMKILAVLSFIPLAFVFMALAWLFMKLSDGFEKLS